MREFDKLKLYAVLGISFLYVILLLITISVFFESIIIFYILNFVSIITVYFVIGLVEKMYLRIEVQKDILDSLMNNDS